MRCRNSSFRRSCGHSGGGVGSKLMTLTGPGPRRQVASIRPTTLGPTAYSITSSASASTLTGTSSPIALAVLRLRTRSYREGGCSGRSAGVSPFRMRSMATRVHVLAQRQLEDEFLPQQAEGQWVGTKVRSPPRPQYNIDGRQYAMKFAHDSYENVFRIISRLT